MNRLLALLSLLAVASSATPAIEQGADGLLVRTAHYVATFNADSGLLHTLTLADGTALLSNTRLYCDGLPNGRKNFSAKAAAPATATTTADGTVVVEVAGKLLDADGQVSSEYPFSYTARYQFDDSPRVRLAVSLIPDFDSEAVFGFAGQVMGTAAQREFFANTADGLISELAATRSGRTYQSEREPLSATDPYLGVVLKSGQVVQFRIMAGVEGLMNTFFHDSGEGPTSLFFCPLSATARRAAKGTAWTQELMVEAMPLAAWGKAKP